MVGRGNINVLRRISTPCPCRKSDPDVLVMETAENRPRKNPANGMNYT